MCHHGAQARRLKTFGSRTVPCEQVAKAWARVSSQRRHRRPEPRAQIDTYGDTSFHNNSPKSIKMTSMATPVKRFEAAHLKA